MNRDAALERDMARAARAELLLRHELLEEAFASLEAAYVEEWRTTALRDADARERLWHAAGIVRKVRDHLAAIVRNGRLARREIEDLAGSRKRFGIL